MALQEVTPVRGLPSGGTAGQVLMRGTSGPAWGSLSVIDLSHPKYGFAWDGVTDDTAAWEAAIADLDPVRGGTLIAPPKPSYVPNGITEGIPGLVVKGTGTRYLTPGTNGTLGTAILTDGAGAWCWTHEEAATGTISGNEYRGAVFENVNFIGTADTAGGLHLYTANNRVVNCAAIGHTTGHGFWAEPPAAGADASWSYYESNYALDCLTGFQFGPDDADTGRYGSGTAVDCITHKNAGIAHTGTGFLVTTQNFTILGGKCEKDLVGLEITAFTGVNVYGMRSELCNTAYKLNRASAPGYASRIRLDVIDVGYGSGNAVEIGAFNEHDIVTCSTYRPIVDSSGTALIVGDAIEFHDDNDQVIQRYAVNGSEIATVTMTSVGYLRYNATGTGAGFRWSIPAGGQFYVSNAAAAYIFRIEENGQVRIPNTLRHEGASLGFFNKAVTTQPAANPDTTGATLGELETEVNELKAALRSLGLIAT